MPFTAVTYNTGAAPGLDGPAFNAMQTQFAAAINSFERDLFTPFVFSGLTATRDGTTLSQLNVTAGVAFLTQSGVNSELFRQSLSSSTQSTSGHPSTTMYLFLNPDGTWAWQTSSTPPTNALAICHVTTDGSSNILTVTDDRVLATSLLANMAGTVNIPNAGLITFDRPLGSANQLMDLQQSYGLYSDNTGTQGTTRTWLDGPDRGEFHMGPRSGTNWLDWVRARTTRFTIALGKNASPNSALFEVTGGPTSLDAGKITTDGSGNVTINGKATYNKTLGGANQTLQSWLPTDGTKEWRVNYNTDGTISFFDATDAKVALKLLTSGGILTDNGAITTDGSGNLNATSLQDNSKRVAVTGAGAAWATQANIGIGPLATRPAAGVKGRLFVETPFS